MIIATISRRIVSVGTRHVHLRTGGEGPRLLMIHGSPASSEFFAPLIRDLADEFCCIAPDTPGFGDSEPLSPEASGIASLAAATAALIERLQCAPCLVFGSHTGAAIALELAALRPDLVSGVALDGVPIFTSAEQAALFEDYFEPLQVDERGGHFARTWTRIRDMFIWFPWTTHDPSHLNGADLPPPASAHRWVSMFFQAAPHYAPAYRAAIAYGERAAAAAATQPRPALYLANDTDMLAPHLQRLPPLKSTDRVARTSAAPGEWLRVLREGLRRIAAAERVSSGALAAIGQSPQDGFVNLPFGQLRVRRFGAEHLPPLLLLHDAPGSGAMLEPLARALSSLACVWLPDLPGCGASTALAVAVPAIADYAAALEPWIATLGTARLRIYGRGCGAAVALSLATRPGTRVQHLLLEELLVSGAGVELPDERICPVIGIEADGSHWYRTWQMLRDSQTFWPWYATRATHLLRMTGDYSAQHLHDWTCESLRQPAVMHCLPRAACAADNRALLAGLQVPVNLLLRRGHPLLPCAQTAQQLAPAATLHLIDDQQRATALAGILATAQLPFSA